MSTNQGTAAVPLPGPTLDRGVRFDLRRQLPTLLALGALVALVACAAITTPAFLDPGNVLAVLRSAAIVGIAALGMTFVTVSGNFFSLSVEQTAALSAVTFALLISGGFGWPLAIVGTLTVAVLLGLAQGGVVSLGLNPIITTLGFGAGIAGFTSILTDNKLVRLGSDEAEWIGRARPFEVPTQVWAFLAAIILTWVVLRRLRIGRIIVLAGANPAAARASGIMLAQARLLAFTLASLTAGVVGIFTAAQIGQGNVIQFEGFNIDVIAAVLVGGTAVQGGDGSAKRTAFGAIFIASLTNFMLINNFSYGIRITVLGAAVVVAATIFHVLRSRRG
jgi:simple sugar transport system permease protein/ribose transport system permease protein